MYLALAKVSEKLLRPASYHQPTDGIAMRRILILSALVGFTGLASLGCKNAVHGRCDCQYDPANMKLSDPSNPYPTVGAPVSVPGKVTMPAPTPGTGSTPVAPAPTPMPLIPAPAPKN
jgi:hypothetical protein